MTEQRARTIDWMAVVDELGPRFAERSAEHDEAETFVAENYEELKRRRVFSAPVPVELGGGGASYGEVFALLRGLARYCGSTALALSMHMHQLAVPAWRWYHGDRQPVEGLLRRVAQEELVLVSSGGSDWLDGSGTAEKVDGGFRINGRKRFASGVPAGDLLMTMAIYNDPAAGPTVLHFPLPLRAQGVTILDTWHTLGMRGTGSHEVEVKDVFIPEAAIGARRPAGVWGPVYHLVAMLALPLIYSVYVGIAEAARDKAVAHARRSEDDRDRQMAVGELETELRAAQLALDSALAIAQSATPGDATTNEVLIRRTLCGRACLRVMDKALEVCGGASFFRSYGLERLFRDMQAARFHPIPEKAQARLSGRLALGLGIDG